MNTRELPSEAVMREAFLGRDPTYDGVFVTAVRTTGVFCRPTCPAKKPLPTNVSFFGTPREALLSGYRPCRRCRPLESPGTPPDWLRPLLDEVEADPARRWRDHDVRARGMSPERVRRWFKQHHSMTFHAYSRARRLGAALGRVKNGDGVSRAAFAAGYDSLSGFQDAFRQYFGDSPTRLDDAVVVRVARVPTPLGPMLVAATDDALRLVEFVDRRMLPTQIERLRRRTKGVFVHDRNALIDRVERELADYFTGDLRAFETPMAPGGTAFQESVWQALRAIPYGHTSTYAELARAVGRPQAVRAVGRANGANGLAILVPCHRVVGSDGKLVGYGGGLWRKRRLLDLERESLSSTRRPRPSRNGDHAI